MKRLPSDLQTARLVYHIGTKCGRVARTAHDTNGQAILPTDPSSADYEHVLNVIGRKLTIDEADDFIKGWQRGFKGKDVS